MKKIVLIIWMGLLLVGSLLLCSKEASAENKLIVPTSAGMIMGKIEQETRVWWGVPYGESTAGSMRWRKPVMVNSWKGVYRATRKKKPAAGLNVNTEDCLYLNIYRPNHDDKELPVMVYLHGGGNSGGTANRDFHALAKATNSVIISVEFRQGAFGWLNVPALKTGDAKEDSGNYALLDIRLALQWVHKNAAHFGGNPKNITLAGFSAGGRDVMLCVISPIMKGLFHKAIVFSGGMVTCAPETGQESALSKLADIFVKRGTFTSTKKALEWLEDGETEEVRNALYSLTTKEVQKMYKATGMRMSEFPQCFRDGTVIPKHGFKVIAEGKYNRVPIILGSSTSEFSKYGYWLNSSISVPANKYGSKIQAYSYVEKTAKQFMKDKKHKNIYGFRFGWGENSKVTSPYIAREVGADHGSVVNFLLENYVCRYDYLQGSMYKKSNQKGREALTKKMQKYIKRFMKKGKTGGKWKRWKKSKKAKKMIVFNAGKKKTKIHMTAKTIHLKTVLKNMKKSLSQYIYNKLRNEVLGDRYFSPTSWS